jgi:hypothetical protein
LKAKLIAESKNLGISLSEYCESILQNKDTLLSEKDFAKKADDIALGKTKNTAFDKTPNSMGNVGREKR